MFLAAAVHASSHSLSGEPRQLFAALRGLPQEAAAAMSEIGSRVDSVRDALKERVDDARNGLTEATHDARHTAATTIVELGCRQVIAEAQKSFLEDDISCVVGDTGTVHLHKQGMLGGASSSVSRPLTITVTPMHDNTRLKVHVETDCDSTIGPFHFRNMAADTTIQLSGQVVTAKTKTCLGTWGAMRSRIVHDPTSLAALESWLLSQSIAMIDSPTTVTIRVGDIMLNPPPDTAAFDLWAGRRQKRARRQYNRMTRQRQRQRQRRRQPVRSKRRRIGGSLGTQSAPTAIGSPPRPQLVKAPVLKPEDRILSSLAEAAGVATIEDAIPSILNTLCARHCVFEVVIKHYRRYIAAVTPAPVQVAAGSAAS